MKRWWVSKWFRDAMVYFAANLRAGEIRYPEEMATDGWRWRDGGLECATGCLDRRNTVGLCKEHNAFRERAKPQMM